MWGMLCARGKDLAVDALAIAADDASGQALGWKGLLLGWLPAARRGVQAQAARALDAWRAQRAPAPPAAL
jgi:hypothetical protein